MPKATTPPIEAYTIGKPIGWAMTPASPRTHKQEAN